MVGDHSLTWLSARLRVRFGSFEWRERCRKVSQQTK